MIAAFILSFSALALANMGCSYADYRARRKACPITYGAK